MSFVKYYQPSSLCSSLIIISSIIGYFGVSDADVVMRNYGRDGNNRGDVASVASGQGRSGNYKRFPLYPSGKSNKIVQNESVTAIDESMWEQIVIRALANPKEWAQLRQALDKIDSDLKAMTGSEDGRRNGSGKSTAPKWKFTYHRVTSPLLSPSLNGSRKGDGGKFATGESFKGKVKAFAAVSIVDSLKHGYGSSGSGSIGDSGNIDGKPGSGYEENGEDSHWNGDSGNRISTSNNERNPWRGRKQDKSHRSWSRTHLEEEIAKMSHHGSHPEEANLQKPGEPATGNEKSTMVTKPPLLVSPQHDNPEWKDILQKYHSTYHAADKKIEHHHHHHHHHHALAGLIESHRPGSRLENLVRKEETGGGSVRKSTKTPQESVIIITSDNKDHEIGGATISAAPSSSSSSKYSAEFHTAADGDEQEGGSEESNPNSWNSFLQNSDLDDNQFNAFKSHRRTPLEYKI